MMRTLPAFAFFALSVAIFAEKPMIVAHRGASREAPENTIPAFELAWKQGADAIEGDFHLTQDGHIVCIHDKDTKRIAGKQLIIAESRLADLQQLDVGIHKGKAYAGTTIPTIEQVFDTVPPNKTIYIEVKCGTAIVPALVEAIKHANIKPEQVVVISFDKNVIKAIKTAAPRLKASWLCGFKQSKSGSVSPSFDHVLATLEQIGADGLSAGKDHLGEPLVSRIQAEGYEFHVWTVDNPEAARNFLDWGAKSITTNVPGRMKQALAGNP
ncbi:Glycerophosphodiester phosphodiesterase [Pontiella desulfatans]|uniref:Glycerophosphodiester phosphodiesterase n=1 Tax=Pontiella desulfatans TaxID=2750659 RepID=A0A6C2U7F4_PONDE|nr:glycerophosphodiester phosphodiesterase [Pontiella desulfatans]VGO16008.1 Glycerophosphodiester phosphodiesterase [Pontiella desulfatans]